MKQYNEHFISCFEEESYEKELNRHFSLQLMAFMRSYKNRYKLDLHENVFADAILYKESLDHYITKKFLTDPNIQEQEYFKNYIEKYLQQELDFIIKQECPINNHFLNTISEEQLKSIIDPETFEKYQIVKEKVNNRHNEIINRIKENALLTQEELNFICDYYAFNREKDNGNHKLLVEYIFNTLTKPDNKLVANQFVSDAILSFIPKYIDSKNDADFANTRILNDSSCNCMGTQYATHIAIERKQFFKLDFHKGKDIELPKRFQEHSNSYVTYMQTIFHELSHTYQQMKMYDEEYNEKGYMYIMRRLLSRNQIDYNMNHDLYEMEIDADQKGWIHSREFYNDFIKDEELKTYLTKKCSVNAAKEHFRRIDSYRYEKDIIFIDMSDIDKMSKIIKENPNLIQEYPMLKTFYKENGEIDLSFLKKPGLKKTTIGKNYTKYALLHYPEEIRKITEETKEQSDFSQIVSTLYSAAMNESRRIKNHEFVEIKEEFNGTKLRIPLDEEIFDKLKKQRLHILDNAINILNNPCIINRKTNFFSPSTYVDKLTEKRNENVENGEFEIIDPPSAKAR